MSHKRTPSEWVRFRSNAGRKSNWEWFKRNVLILKVYKHCFSFILWLNSATHRTYNFPSQMQCIRLRGRIISATTINANCNVYTEKERASLLHEGEHILNPYSAKWNSPLHTVTLSFIRITLRIQRNIERETNWSRRKKSG